MLRLHFRDVTAGLPYHSAVVFIEGMHSTPHTHDDFYEVMHVRAGRGWHRVNGEQLLLEPGLVVFVRAADVHSFVSIGGKRLEILNTAFPSATWRGLLELAGLADAAGWTRPPMPVIISDHGELAGSAEALLTAFYRSPSKLELLEFLLAVASLLRERAPAGDRQPKWLARACSAMDGEDNLRGGLPRFIQLAAVSPSHLARTMKQFHGCTPVQFVVQRRLALAAAALASSMEPINLIASRLGFRSHAYFSRCFREAYGVTPREYRSRAHRTVVPT